MWDLPGPGLEPVSPALAGGFLTTGHQGSPALSSSWSSVVSFLTSGSLFHLAFSDRTLLVFDCLLSIVLSGLTRFSGLILYISYLSPRIRLFLRNQTGLFSGKLNFKIEVWMLGMLIYLGYCKYCCSACFPVCVFPILVFLGYRPLRGSASSYGSSVFSF